MVRFGNGSYEVVLMEVLRKVSMICVVAQRFRFFSVIVFKFLGKWVSSNVSSIVCVCVCVSCLCLYVSISVYQCVRSRGIGH